MAEMNVRLGKTKASPETMEACPVKKEAKREPTPEEIGAVVEPQEVPEGAMVGAAKDRSRDLCLAIRCHRRLKTRTKRDGRLRQECAATIGWPTCRFVPVMRKRGHRKGLGKGCRSGIKGPGKTLGSRMGGRSLKRRRTKFNFVQGTPKDRTCEKRQRSQPECNNGIQRLSKTPGNRMRGWTGKLDWRLKERTLNEAIRKSPRREIMRLIFESSVGLREPGYCGSVGPRQSGRGNAIVEPRGAAAKDNGGGRGLGERVAEE
jgi:hypothetical protein